VLNCGDDGPSFIYGHNSSTPLPAGTHVRKGDVIALSGNSGLSTGPHCHVEVLPPGFVINTATYGRVDPEEFFDEWPDDLPTTENEDDMALSYEDKLFIQEQIEARHVVTRDRIAALGALLGAKLGIDEAELAKALLDQGQVSISKRP
jgi:murein DD-endopeptidase MepM/ murein hydrolase activator NlpD